ncbi:unnamed protein product, partial [Penicillium discolor]
GRRRPPCGREKTRQGLAQAGSDDARRHPAGRAASRDGGPRLGRGVHAHHRLPPGPPGDRRGKARPRAGAAPHLAGQAARRAGRPAAPGAGGVAERALPGADPARGAQPTARPRRSHGGGQGDRRRAHPREQPRDPSVRLGDHPTATPGRDRRRALLLRGRRRVRPPDRRRRAAGVRGRAQPLALRHPARSHRRRPGRGEDGAAGDRPAGRAPGARGRAVGDPHLPPAAELGRAGAPTGRPGHRGRRGASPPAADREGRAGGAERVRPPHRERGRRHRRSRGRRLVYKLCAL